MKLEVYDVNSFQVFLEFDGTWIIILFSTTFTDIFKVIWNISGWIDLFISLKNMHERPHSYYIIDTSPFQVLIKNSCPTIKE